MTRRGGPHWEQQTAFRRETGVYEVQEVSRLGASLPFIWQNTDRDGIWRGDAASLAKEFDALENDAESVLEELRDRRLIKRLSGRTYFISGWREKDDHDTNHE